MLQRRCFLNIKVIKLYFSFQVIEKCESNHLMILFRDAGCMFRSLYSYFPDTEEIHKVTGTGPKSISKKMIDKLYKYSSDRKQFNVIPAKTVSVSVDALTIHNHLWQVKRPSVPKKSGKWRMILEGNYLLSSWTERVDISSIYFPVETLKDCLVFRSNLQMGHSKCCEGTWDSYRCERVLFWYLKLSLEKQK